jgi:LIVCS family branched-chain amino acid:cation transporter
MNQSLSKKDLLSLSLAIFCLLFGAGNLIYPLALGRSAGASAPFGIIGFFITAILLPLAGLVGMILFDGSYTAFFARLGRIPGLLFIFASMLIIGPIVVIPRCVTLSHTMMAPFLPFDFLQVITPLSSLVFCIIFLGASFLASCRKGKIVTILGNVIAPLLLSAITVIIGKGLCSTNTIIETQSNPLYIFSTGFMMGYQTLDLLGTLFFSSVIIKMMKKIMPTQENLNHLTVNGLKAGLTGLSLLGCIYIGMAALGAFHSHAFINADAGELLSLISFALLGKYGAAIISFTVSLACLSTVIGLGSVVAEYVKVTLLNNTITYVQALLITYLSCIPLSIFGLKYVLAITGGPIVYIGYPLLITTTLCNIAYKIYGFPFIKIPVCLTFAAALASYLMQ